MFQHLGTVRVAMIWLAIAAAGFLVGAWGYYDARKGRIEDITRTARGAALAMAVTDVARLTGGLDDENTDYYKRVKGRLAAVQQVHPVIHCVYIFRIDPVSGEYVNLADSMPEDSPELMRPGEILTGATLPNRASKTFSEGVVTFNESLSDMFGVWVVAYARIEGVKNNNLIRIDIDMHGWRADLLSEAFGRALYAWMLPGLPFAVFLVMKRNRRQTRFIEQLRAAVEQSPVGVVIMDADGVIRYVNNALCGLSKYTREQLIGQNWRTTTDGLDLEKLDRLQRTSAAGKIWVEDFEFERKDGEKYSGRNMSTPVRDESGKIIAFISVVTDITGLMRQANELRQAKERAEAADKAKSIFLATMSHEVRTPLNSISGFSHLLADTDLTEEQREYVETIDSSSKLLSRLAENILDFARIEQGVLRLAKTSADMRALVKGVIGDMAARAEEKGLVIRGDISPGVPKRVRIDPARLRQVLMNLADNAIKFTPSGDIVMSVRVCGPAQAPDAAGKTLRLEFAVSDTGIGVAPEDHARLFLPFVQLDSSSTRHYEGAGLGLAIAQDVVRLMGGDGIAVKSEKDRGATFSFIITCATEE